MSADLRAMIRSTLDEQTLPSGLHVALRPADLTTLVATGRMPEDLLGYLIGRTNGTVEPSPEQDVAAMRRYRRLEAAAAVVEMRTPDGEWERVQLTDEDLDLLAFDDQRTLYGYALDRTQIKSEAAS